jgi:hypothetical protein
MVASARRYGGLSARMSDATGGAALTEWSAPEGTGAGAGPAPPPGSPGYGGGYGYGAGYGPGYGQGWAPPPGAPKPGIIPLRPLGLGEILDGSFSAIRTAALAALGIAAVLVLVQQAARLLLDYSVLHPVATTTTVGPDGTTTVTNASEVGAWIGTTLIVTTVISLVVFLLVTGIMAAIVGERVVGRRVTVRDAWSRLRPVLWPLLRVSFLITLIIGGIIAVALLPGIAVAAGGSGGGGAALIFLGVLVLVVPVVYAWTAFSLAPAVVVLERRGALAALRRSRELVRGAWWRVFGISLLAALIASVVASVLSVPFVVFGGGLTGIFAGRANNNLSFFALLMSAIGGFVGGTLSRPFQGGVTALLYIDRRIRAEALDVALQSATAEPAGAPASMP